jgi:hypothetical protein
MTVVFVSLHSQHSAHDGVCTLKGLFDVNGFLCARLEVWDAALGLAEGLGTLRRDLKSYLAIGGSQCSCLYLTMRLLSSTSILLPMTT